MLKRLVLLLKRLLLLRELLMLLFEAEELSRYLLILLPVVSQGLLSSIAAGNLRLPSKQGKASMSM